ncbi:MAG TPA: glucose 1-dehydrogenase [Burkholderiales bacterium]|jgi:3-oxoacyl-[acyl-carrier protein] reductase|nr:glucose 1-dehydrogenase [Burkholderiales bacterium]
MNLKGKVAIVTGGGIGLGRAYCKALAAAGAKVVVADIQFDAAGTVADEVDGIAVKVDVTSERETQAMAARAIEAYGAIDILVNNAGLYSSIQKRPFTEIPLDEWDRCMAVNVKGVYLCCRAVHPQMKKQKRGKIINISSGTVLGGTPLFLHYVSSKGAVIAFTRALAREVGGDGINVNAITPGLTIADAQQKKMLSEEYLAPRRQARAIKRDQYPEDLTGAVVFLASADSDFITGQTLNVDGGTWML